MRAAKKRVRVWTIDDVEGRSRTDVLGEVFVGGGRLSGNWGVVDAKNSFVLVDFFAFLRSEVDASVGNNCAGFIRLVVISVRETPQRGVVVSTAITMMMR